jgi:hypothetical protein
MQPVDWQRAMESALALVSLREQTLCQRSDGLLMALSHIVTLLFSVQRNLSSCCLFACLWMDGLAQASTVRCIISERFPNESLSETRYVEQVCG